MKHDFPFPKYQKKTFSASQSLIFLLYDKEIENEESEIKRKIILHL
jgi:hypothetical protein